VLVAVKRSDKHASISEIEKRKIKTRESALKNSLSIGQAHLSLILHTAVMEAKRALRVESYQAHKIRAVIKEAEALT
jgi:hypothetical protein